MHSDAYVTDFDSDDDDIAWSHERRFDKNGHLCRSDDSDTSAPSASPESAHVREFGEFEDSHGWVQCQSRSFPGRAYFHNVHSGCNSWYRPLSRFVRIPVVSVKRVIQTDDPTANDLELMAVSDTERKSPLKPGGAGSRDNKLPGAVLDVLARYYHTSQTNLSSAVEQTGEPDSDELPDEPNSPCELTHANIVSEYCSEKEIPDASGRNETDDGINDLETRENSPFTVACLVETELVDESQTSAGGTCRRRCESPTKDDASSSSSSSSSPSPPPSLSLSHSSSSSLSSSPSLRRVVYSVPRLKKIGVEDQIIKWRRTSTVKRNASREPKKFVRDMHGVRTISYDPPEIREVLAELGLKSRRLSDSDSDDKSKTAKRQCVRELEWRELVKNLRPPVLSETSSSASSRSDTSSDDSTSCSCSTCSTCSTCTTLKNSNLCRNEAYDSSSL